MHVGCTENNSPLSFPVIGKKTVRVRGHYEWRFLKSLSPAPEGERWTPSLSEALHFDSFDEMWTALHMACLTAETQMARCHKCDCSVDWSRTDNTGKEGR